MKNLHSWILLLSIFIYAQGSCQVGIGTTSPRGALDINSPTTNNKGLVLPTNNSPTNMTNPQGGALAEGTVMYDNTEKCVKFYNGSTWSNCLCDTCGPSTSTIIADCTQNGFTGSYTSNIPLSGTTFTVTITNNSFSTSTLNLQPSDLVLSGVTGLTVSSVSPTTATLNAGQSQMLTYTITGTPNNKGTLTGTWSKLSLNCSNSVTVAPGVRFAYWGTAYSIGTSTFSTFNSQLTNTANYGPTGTYNKIGGFNFIDITSILGSATAASLLANYDVICIGANTEIDAASSLKIKGYVDGGGVATILLDQSFNTAIFQTFGGTGSVGAGATNGVTTTDTTNNGVFGTGTNASITGFGQQGRILLSQLASGSVVLATETASTNDIALWKTGTGGRAIFSWDEGVYRSSNITGTVIDTPQEIFLHNIMAYLLNARGF
ncbi:hypothetical protein [Chryseobacterium sp. ERMR1:04]|uniref:hypothetical protein n=1 Tax=Chryseobacterium sp. ERMR1:04 TaxID=1705393 RepID=UPI0006C87E05|nr:hypothetical protein [Chryseobacterium sp. ERMR1:04]KPH10887.1 hypothetical protein AMQ68_23840 [Chryseobacterium sp. ERMR1:04]